MASISAIRDGIQTTVTTNITSFVGVYDTVPDSPNLPALITMPDSGPGEGTMSRGFDEHRFRLILLVSRSSSGTSQDTLDGYINSFGSSSLRQVFRNNKTLGLTDTCAYFEGWENYGAQYEAVGIPHLGVEIILRVVTRGDA